MQDSIVSVRMPEALLEELKKTSSEHYMDLSEAVRSIVRNSLTEYQANKSKVDRVATQQLIEGLRSIIKELEDEDE